MSTDSRFHSQGNRQSVPREVSSAHFLYKTKAPALPQADVDLVVKAVRAHVHAFGLNPAQIDIAGTPVFQAAGDATLQAYRRLRDFVTQQVPGGRYAPDILVCEWASPHVDESYAGDAFLSWVLHTGEYPYLMQTLHSHKQTMRDGGSVIRTQTSARVLNVGDTFIFDPTTPHMAAPVRPGQDQLLIMLQLDLPDESPQQRKELLERFAPMAEDHDEREVFEGIF